MYNEEEQFDGPTPLRRGRIDQRGWHGQGGPGGHRRGGRMRRGEIRTALLGALADEPGHGYEVMQRLEERSGGTWRPSPGSVYPTLQQLQDEGLVTSTERDASRLRDHRSGPHRARRADQGRRSRPLGGRQGVVRFAQL